MSMSEIVVTVRISHTICWVLPQVTTQGKSNRYKTIRKKLLWRMLPLLSCRLPRRLGWANTLAFTYSRILIGERLAILRCYAWEHPNPRPYGLHAPIPMRTLRARPAVCNAPRCPYHTVSQAASRSCLQESRHPRTRATRGIKIS